MGNKKKKLHTINNSQNSNDTSQACVFVCYLFDNMLQLVTNPKYTNPVWSFLNYNVGDQP